MKVCAVSPRLYEAGAKMAAIKAEVLDFLAETTADLVVLPGWRPYMPTPDAIARVLRRGVHVFVEVKKKRGGKVGKRGAQPCVVTSRRLIELPKQIFAQNPTAHDLDELAEKLAKRTVRIRSRTVTFVLCGEVIAFKKNGKAKMGRSLPLGDIVANPTHTTMGRWMTLGPKLASLSRRRDLVVHVANNDRASVTVTSNLRFYRSGRQIGENAYWGNLAWREVGL